MRVIFEFSSKKTSFKRIKSFPFLCTDGCRVHKLKERKKSDKKGRNKILTFVFISSFIFARRTSPKTIPRRCGTILETNPPPTASPKWNYLLCRDFYGEPLLACAVSSPPSCTLAAYPCIVACSSLPSPPLSRTFVTFPCSRRRRRRRRRALAPTSGLAFITAWPGDLKCAKCTWPC